MLLGRRKNTWWSEAELGKETPPRPSLQTTASAQGPAHVLTSWWHPCLWTVAREESVYHYLSPNLVPLFFW